MNSTEENKTRYESQKNKAKNVISKAMIDKVEGETTELKSCPHGILRPVRGLKVDSEEVEQERCMR